MRLISYVLLATTVSHARANSAIACATLNAVCANCANHIGSRCTFPSNKVFARCTPYGTCACVDDDATLALEVPKLVDPTPLIAATCAAYEGHCSVGTTLPGSSALRTLSHLVTMFCPVTCRVCDGWNLGTFPKDESDGCDVSRATRTTCLTHDEKAISLKECWLRGCCADSGSTDVDAGACYRKERKSSRVAHGDSTQKSCVTRTTQSACETSQNTCLWENRKCVPRLEATGLCQETLPNVEVPRKYTYSFPSVTPDFDKPPETMRMAECCAWCHRKGFCVGWTFTPQPAPTGRGAHNGVVGTCALKFENTDKNAKIVVPPLAQWNASSWTMSGVASDRVAVTQRERACPHNIILTDKYNNCECGFPGSLRAITGQRCKKGEFCSPQRPGMCHKPLPKVNVIRCCQPSHSDATSNTVPAQCVTVCVPGDATESVKEVCTRHSLAQCPGHHVNTGCDVSLAGHSTCALLGCDTSGPDPYTCAQPRSGYVCPTPSSTREHWPGGHCSACTVGNCRRCHVGGSQCIECNAGYVLTNGKCDNRVGDDHCSVRTEAQVCTACVVGYALKATACVPCPTGCATCASHVFCQECVHLLYVLTHDGTCQLAPLCTPDTMVMPAYNAHSRATHTRHAKDHERTSSSPCRCGRDATADDVCTPGQICRVAPHTGQARCAAPIFQYVGCALSVEAAGIQYGPHRFGYDTTMCSYECRGYTHFALESGKCMCGNGDTESRYDVNSTKCQVRCAGEYHAREEHKGTRDAHWCGSANGEVAAVYTQQPFRVLSVASDVMVSLLVAPLSSNPKCAGYADDPVGMVQDVVQHVHADIIVAHVQTHTIFAPSGGVLHYAFHVTINAPNDAALFSLSRETKKLQVNKEVCLSTSASDSRNLHMLGRFIKAPIVRKIDGLVYIGCYADETSDMVRGPKRKNYTTESCAMACDNAFFFALQDGGWCVCSDHFGAQLHAIAWQTAGKQVDTDCGTVCPGEDDLTPLRLCGGIRRNAVYQNRRTNKKNVVVRYVGCYVSSTATSAHLRAASHDMVFGPKDAGHTLESCAAACRHYRFVALKNAGFCSCGNLYANGARFAQRDDAQCENACRASDASDASDASVVNGARENRTGRRRNSDVESQITLWRTRADDNLANITTATWRCGGTGVNAIYANVEYTRPNAIEFVGCYVDDQGLDMVAGPKGEWPSNHALCSESCDDYRYFALRGVTHKCVCGDDYGTSWHIRRVNDSLCETECPSVDGHTGSPTERFCGADNYAAVYAVAKPLALRPSMVDLTFLGCYVGNHGNDFLQRHDDEIYTSVTCSKKCTAYKYFALYNFGECLCSHRYATSKGTYRLLQDSECGNFCDTEKDDLFSPKRYCGGRRTKAVYRQPLDLNITFEGICSVALGDRVKCAEGETLERDVCELIPGCCYDNGLGGQAGACYRARFKVSDAPIPPTGVPEGGRCGFTLNSHCESDLVCQNKVLGEPHTCVASTVLDDAHAKLTDSDLLLAVQQAAAKAAIAIRVALRRGDRAAAKAQAAEVDMHAKQGKCRCVRAQCAGDSKSAAEQCIDDLECRPDETSTYVCSNGMFEQKACFCYRQNIDTAEVPDPMIAFFTNPYFIITAPSVVGLCIVCGITFLVSRWVRQKKRNKHLDFTFKATVVEAPPVQFEMTIVPGYAGSSLPALATLPLLNPPLWSDESADGSKSSDTSAHVDSRPRKSKSAGRKRKSTLSSPEKSRKRGSYAGHMSDINKIDLLMNDNDSNSNTSTPKPRRASATENEGNEMNPSETSFGNDAEAAKPKPSGLFLPDWNTRHSGSVGSRDSTCSQLIGAVIVETNLMKPKKIVTAPAELNGKHLSVTTSRSRHTRSTSRTKNRLVTQHEPSRAGTHASRLRIVKPTSRSASAPSKSTSRSKRKMLPRRSGSMNTRKRQSGAKRTKRVSVKVKVKATEAESDV